MVGRLRRRRARLRAVYPESGIDWEYFGSTAKKEKLDVATEQVYSVLLDTSLQQAKNQEEAPTIVAKLKDAGVTTVMLFTSFQMNQALLKAATELDYFPSGCSAGWAQDIEITAILNGIAPSRWSTCSGSATCRSTSTRSTTRSARGFDWYWGGNQGIYSAATFGTLHQLNGVELRRPQAHAEELPAGDVQLRRAAAPPASSCRAS